MNIVYFIICNGFIIDTKIINIKPYNPVAFDELKFFETPAKHNRYGTI